MYKKLLICVLSFCTLAICAQDSLNSGQWFNKAQFYLFNGQYKEASKIYQMLLDKDNTNKMISFHLSLCYLNLPSEASKSVPLLENTFGETYKNAFTSNIPTVIYLGNSYSLSPEIVLPEKKAVSSGFHLDPNQPYSNICVAENGQMMVFVNSQTSKNKIFYTKKENNVWQEPKEITSKLGTEENIFPSSLSADGTRLYLTIYNEFESDIYVSNYNGKFWSAPKKLSMKINSLAYDSHACESSDGKVLYFASSRSGGFGGMDIYFSNRSNTEWSDVYNAGALINTFLNDEYPQILNNGSTLLYSSQGFKKGKDGYDMYFCHLVGDNIWTEPENLGAPVNTSEDDISFVPMIEESRVFFLKTISKNPEKKANPETAPKLLIFGTLANIEKKALSENASIVITSINSDETNLSVKPNAEGKYALSLTEGAYKLTFKDDNYISLPINVAIPLIYKSDSLQLNIELKK